MDRKWRDAGGVAESGRYGGHGWEQVRIGTIGPNLCLDPLRTNSPRVFHRKHMLFAGLIPGKKGLVGFPSTSLPKCRKLYIGNPYCDANAMSHREFNHLLSSLNGLSPEQLAALRRELDSKLLATSHAPAHPEETAFDRLERAGLIGCLVGTPGAPTDLSTNPKHMEGFGNG